MQKQNKEDKKLKEKRLKLITEILAIVVICLVSFVGVYTKKANKMQNKVKDYVLSKDLKGYRELVFNISDATEVLDSSGKVIGNTDSYTDDKIESNSYQKTETKVNSDESLTKENYEKSKNIIEKRLKNLNVEDYNISVDENTGNIYLQIPENGDTDHVVSNILQVAKFEIKDSEDTSKVYIKNEDVKKVSAVYNTTTSGTTVYLRMEFKKNGENTLKQISTNEYATKNETKNTTTNETSDDSSDKNTTNESSEEENSSDKNTTTENESSSDSSASESTTQKKIILSIDSNEMITTSFDDPIQDGVIDLSMGNASTDSSKISENLQSASTIAAVVNSGEMPLTYKISQNNYINTDITNDMVKKVVYAIIAVLAVAMLLLVLKYKTRGLISAIAYVGFIGLYMLLVRYTNVTVSIESLVAGSVVLVVNYIITYKLLNIHESDAELKSRVYKEELKSTIIKLMPLIIISVVFPFVKWTKISTFGMFMFWGIILSVVYNFTVTKDMLD